MIDDALDLRTAVFDVIGNASRADQWPRIVKMAERRLNQVLRTNDQVTSASIAMVDGAGTLPDDYIEMIVVGSTDRPYREVYTANYRQSLDVYDYAIEGKTIKAAVDANDLPITYYAALPTLANDLNASNWLLTLAPDVYLYAAICEALTSDPEAKQTYDGYYTRALAGLKTISNRQRFGNSNVRINAV